MPSGVAPFFECFLKQLFFQSHDNTDMLPVAFFNPVTLLNSQQTSEPDFCPSDRDQYRKQFEGWLGFQFESCPEFRVVGSEANTARIEITTSRAGKTDTYTVNHLGEVYKKVTCTPEAKSRQVFERPQLENPDANGNIVISQPYHYFCMEEAGTRLENVHLNPNQVYWTKMSILAMGAYLLNQH